MFNKKYFLSFLLIMVVLFAAISVVSATDTDGLNSVDQNNVNDLMCADVIEDNNIASAIVLSSNNEQTFEDIQTKINTAKENDTILLNGEYVGNGTPINVNVNGLKFIAVNYTVLNANGLSSILKVTANDVYFEGIEFINGNSTNGGAILANSSSITIKDCIFNNNTAVTGGGIYSQNSTITIIYSEFRYCGANDGGGIFIDENSTSNIRSSKFYKNKAPSAGGAIHLQANLTIDDCIFEENKGTYGSCIYINYKHPTYSVNNSKFINNYAGLGAIYTQNSDLIIDNSEFINNTATTHGGAIFAYENTSVTINNSKFTNNVAIIQLGGAIASSSSSSDLAPKLDVYNCLFESNKGNFSGAIGVVYTICNLDNNRFIDNEGDIAGAFFAQESIFNVKNSIFDNNNAPIGGAMVIESSEGTIEDCNFTNNNASIGGAMIVELSDVTIEDCNFANNKAENGGAISCFENNLTIKSSNFDNNKANIGGAISGGDNNLNIEYCNFNNNEADVAGVMDSENDNLTINECNFTGNTGNDTGAIKVYGNGSVLIANSTFKDNSAVNNSGAITANCSLTVLNSIFKNNSGDKGGAISSQGENTIINSSVFYQNKGRLGASIFLNGDNAIICNDLFIENVAESCGGGVYANASNISVLNSVFISNSANYTGGAITWVSENNTNGLVSNCYFVNNYGVIGGVINWGGANGKVDQSIFLNNSADLAGAICWRGSNGTIIHSIFDGNHAETGDCVVSSKVYITADENYWGMNASSIEEFNSTGLLAYLNENSTLENYVPNTWILMSIYNETEIKYGDNTTFAVALDTITDGTEFVEFEGTLPLYIAMVNYNGEEIPVVIPSGESDEFTRVVDSPKFDIVAQGVDYEVARFTVIAPLNTSIIVYNVTTKSGDDDVLYISLVDSNNDPLVNASLKVGFTNQISAYYFNVTTDENGIAEIPLKDISAAYYDVLVEYDGAEIYFPSSAKGFINIEGLKTNIDFDVTELSKGKYLISGTVIDEKSNPVHSGWIDVTINGKTSKKVKVNEDGTFSIVVKGPKSGSFDITVNYYAYKELPEPSNYTDSNLTIKYTVNETKDISDITTLPNTGNPLVVLIISLLALPILRFKK